MKSNIFAISGQTCLRKTEMSIEIAKSINADIINVDSVKMYKKLNIGSAKPNKIQIESVKHHLIDIIEPYDIYSVKKFIYDLKLCIKNIEKRNKKILLVGGTMMYFSIISNGLNYIPKIKNYIKKIVSKRHNKYWFNFIGKYDHKIIKNININDTRKIRKISEIMLSSNKSYYKVLSKKKIFEGFKIKICGIITNNKNFLKQNIIYRLNNMLKNGFIEEVKNIIKDKRINENLPSMKSIGYKDAVNFLMSRICFKDFIENTIKSTNMLAKKQKTWIKNWKGEMKIFYFNYDSDYMCIRNKIINYFMEKQR